MQNYDDISQKAKAFRVKEWAMDLDLKVQNAARQCNWKSNGACTNNDVPYLKSVPCGVWQLIACNTERFLENSYSYACGVIGQRLAKHIRPG